MYHFTIPMALMDFVPVVLAAGSVNVFMAGFFKALWKLLYAANICDFVALEEMFMPVNSLGLLFVGLSIVSMLCRKKKSVMLSAAPPVIASSIPFIMMMVLGLGGLCAGLSVLSAKMKKGKVKILFILSFVCAMAMGFMSSQDVTLAWVNWVEQSINIISQGCLLAGVIILHRAGLKDWTWEESL